MGYSHSPATVRKRWALLTRFLKGEDQIIFNTRSIVEADTRARHIRECFHIAKLHPTEFGALLEHTYKIRVEGAMVICRREIPFEAPTRSIKRITNRATVPSVIQGWIDHQPYDGSIELVDCPLTTPDIEELTAWADTMQLTFLIVGSGFVITPR